VSRRHPFRPLAQAVGERFPDLADPVAEIASGRVTVNGLVVTNPRALVRRDATIAMPAPAPLRGEVKLQAALDAFSTDVSGRVALDLGAAAGGFTRALLRRGARRVYAVDAGHGQLLGSLRQEGRVVNLERTNLSELTQQLVPDAVDVLTADLSYIALATALPQLNGVAFRRGAELIALVKPMFELARGQPPDRSADWLRAVALASAGAQAAGWRVAGSMRSPVTGASGAVEFFVHGRRLATGGENARVG